MLLVLDHFSQNILSHCCQFLKKIVGGKTPRPLPAGNASAASRTRVLSNTFSHSLSQWQNIFHSALDTRTDDTKQKRLQKYALPLVMTAPTVRANK